MIFAIVSDKRLAKMSPVFFLGFTETFGGTIFFEEAGGYSIMHYKPKTETYTMSLSQELPHARGKVYWSLAYFTGTAYMILAVNLLVIYAEQVSGKSLF
jgi:hypothetical protein